MNKAIRPLMTLVPMAAAVVGLVTACGKPEERSTPTTVATEQEKVQYALKDTFGTGYNPMTQENRELAARIVGASAYVAPVDGSADEKKQTLFDIDVRIAEMGLTTLGIQAQGQIAPGRTLQPLKVTEELLSETRQVQARCLSTNCNHVIVMLTVKDEVKPAGDVVQEERAKEFVLRQYAMIFSRQKAKALVKTPVEASDEVTADVAATVNPQVVDKVDYSQPLALRWSASSGTGDLLQGGTRQTFDQAIESMKAALDNKAQDVPAPTAADTTQAQADDGGQVLKEKTDDVSKAETDKTETGTQTKDDKSKKDE